MQQQQQQQQQQRKGNIKRPPPSLTVLLGNERKKWEKVESGRRHQDVIKITSAATQKYYTCTYKRNTCHKKRKKPSVATSQPQLGFSSPVTRRSFFFSFGCLAHFIFRQRATYYWQQKQPLFSCKLPKLWKKGEKKRDERENVWCAHLYMCTRRGTRHCFFVFFSERRIGCLPRCLPPVTLFLFFKRPAPRPLRRRRRRPSHPQPLPYPPSTTLSLSLPSSFSSISEKDGKKERKNWNQNES